ncbi:hypothetical protein [Acinetobacter bereziniae]|uniref:hypothetical protein n=1 Tax=Acinetobacter bereziniae TaxID=106648 RepID=UPI00125077CA|nr:hypothetical protein [Acinetobacter bereziniae]
MSELNEKRVFFKEEFLYYSGLSDSKKIVWLSTLSYFLSLKIREVLYNYREKNHMEDVKIDDINNVHIEIFSQIESIVRKNFHFSDNVFFEILERNFERFDFDFLQFIKYVRMRIECQ